MLGHAFRWVLAIVLSGGAALWADPLVLGQNAGKPSQAAAAKKSELAKVGDPLVAYTPKKALNAGGARKCETC